MRRADGRQERAAEEIREERREGREGREGRKGGGCSIIAAVQMAQSHYCQQR